MENGLFTQIFTFLLHIVLQKADYFQNVVVCSLFIFIFILAENVTVTVNVKLCTCGMTAVI